METVESVGEWGGVKNVETVENVESVGKWGGVGGVGRWGGVGGVGRWGDGDNFQGLV
ncbi:MAG: hypothetical protein F6K63_08595 [Moorea sp. SIO1G6]|nr:hypothetical protein [Moorena sp. SIO1G6]